MRYTPTSRPQTRWRRQICCFHLSNHAQSAEFSTRKTFGSQFYTKLKRHANLGPTFEQSQITTSKHRDTKTDSGCRPTRGSNYRASNSTENARKQVSISQQLNAAAIKQQERPRSKVTFFRCGKPGHIVAIQADAKIVVVERSCDYSG